MVQQTSSNFAAFGARLLAFGLPFLGGFLGLIFCLVQSPQSQSLRYERAAHSVLGGNITMAHDIAMQGVNSAPLSASAWFTLAQALQQKGDLDAAQNAYDMAQHLDKGELPPAPRYAIPAQFKLSALSPRVLD